MKDLNLRVSETVADIAYIAGTKGYYSGDSRADMRTFIWWAEQFETLHNDNDWGKDDYIITIEDYTHQKLPVLEVA